MFEKVNPSHPDKVADRIAGALVDLAYTKEKNPKVAIEVLLGHKNCFIIGESSYDFSGDEIHNIVMRIAPQIEQIAYKIVKQDIILSKNQEGKMKCGDNGIFKGVPVTEEQVFLTTLAREIYDDYPTDGKYVVDKDKLVICQSNVNTEELKTKFSKAIINPLGDWTGGPDVDAGATNRKLGSDMGDSITGGGLHGKDLSKADVSVNIYAWLRAQETGEKVEYTCAIGDDNIDGIPYEDIVESARQFIENLGGFEKLAEWGLI